MRRNAAVLSDELLLELLRLFPASLRDERRDGHAGQRRDEAPDP